MKRIMTLAALKSGRVTKSRQDGSREFISVLACISATGRAIPPLLVYPGASQDLRASWVEDITADSGVHFTKSSNGWSSNKIGRSWLEQVFERYTKPKRATTKRLLIVDGHSSHVNMEFVDWADRHNIILLILPPHTTHRLQPLDVGLFQPLSTAYSKEIDLLMNNGKGMVSMSKALFYSMFKPAWDAAFTETNIQHAWQKSGIWPIYPNDILAQVTRPPPTPKSASELALKTPQSSKAIRQFQKSYIRSPTTVKREKLFHTNEILATKVSILEHENKGLRMAIELQKRKGKKNKRLNLAGEEGGLPVCYSPAKVEKARRFQEAKEAKEAEESRQKEARKVQRAINKEKKESRAIASQLAKESQTENQGTATTLAKKKKTVAPKPKKAAGTMSKVKKRVAPKNLLKQAPQKVVVEEEVGEVVVFKNRRGREIVLPTRFK
jgi:hypothetical protein